FVGKGLNLVGLDPGAHVPAASPIFIADSKIFELPWLFVPIFLAQVSHGTHAGKGDILDPLLHFLDCSAADVPANIRFASELFAQIHELMRPKMIVFGHFAPMSIDHRGSEFSRADPIAPVIFVGKTAARPAQHRDFDSFKSGDYIVADSAGVGNGTVLPDPNALINAVSEVFGKLPIDITTDRVFGLIGMNDQLTG